MITRPSHLLVALFVVALAVALVVPASGQSVDQVTVIGADEMRESALVSDAGLTSALSEVRPRVVLQYANLLRPSPLHAVPSPFAVVLSETPPRVVVQYANTLRHVPLVPGPPPLQTVLAQMSPRVVLQYANQNRRFTLAYPGALLGDATPPQITDIQALKVSDDTIMVRWKTNEYADSEVDYGTTSGVYTGSVSNPLYAKQHELTLIGLPPDTAIYFRVRSTDQSGNTAQSAEQAHAAEEEVYLPLVLRNW